MKKYRAVSGAVTGGLLVTGTIVATLPKGACGRMLSVLADPAVGCGFSLGNKVNQVLVPANTGFTLHEADLRDLCDEGPCSITIWSTCISFFLAWVE